MYSTIFISFPFILPVSSVTILFESKLARLLDVVLPELLLQLCINFLAI